MTTTPASGAADLPEALRLSNEDAAMLEQAASMLEEHAVELKAAGADSASAAADCSAYVVRKMAVALIRHEEQLAALAAGQATAAQQPGAAYGALPDERAAFEAWIKKDCGDLSTFGSGQNTHYSNSAVNNAWSGWKARASHGQAPAGESLRTDALCDLSYSHGLKAGWNYCASDDLAGFERAQKIGAEALRTLKSPTAQAAPAAVAGCTRSHPHENMDSACRAKAAIAEMQNMAARGAEATAQDLERFVSMLAAAPTTQPAPQLPERDASVPAEQQGLFRKFEVRRVDGTDKPGGKHHGCTYFVLDVDHDPCARPALAAYAAACEATHPALAADLLTKWGAAPTTQPSPAAQGDALDAARWHWLSEHIQVAWNEGKFTSLVRIVSEQHRQSLNASVDRMMAGDWSDADAARAAQEGK